MLTAACLEMVIKDLVTKGKVVLGSSMKHLLTASDVCAAQFKCGTPLPERAALVAKGGLMHKQVQVQHLYGATSHFKGRHDSEGGAVKAQLRLKLAHQKVDVEEEGASIMRSAADCVAYGNKYLSSPSSKSEPSIAHRNRAKVQERTFLLAPPVSSKPGVAAVGIQRMHRVAFLPKGEDKVGVWWSQVGCACLPCCTGRFSSCEEKAMVPALALATLKEKKEAGDADGADV